MTQIATIATTPVAAPGTTGVTAALNGNMAGLFGGAGMSFMDMIFARSLSTTVPTMTAPSTSAPALATPGAMTAEQALAATKNVAAGLSQSDISLIAADLTAAGIDPASLQDMLVELSASVTTPDAIVTAEQGAEIAVGTITTAQPVATKELQEAMKLLRSMIQGMPADISAEAAMTAAPVTPAELTKIMESIASQMKADKKPALTGTVTITASAGSTATDEGDKTAIDSAVNAMIAAPITDPAVTGEGDTLAPLPAQREAIIFGDGAQAGKPANANIPGGYVPNAAAAGAAQNNNAATNGAGGSSIPALAGGMTTADGLLDSAGWDSIYPDGLEWTQQGHGTGTPSLSVTGTAQFASLVSHAQSATAPHPATQMVAAQITKGAAEGETKSMTLKLDPPELGRIEIRMDFAKEKGMKAHVVVEKQETYLMLQRDAHVLERALQDAGIGAEDGGLSFELAQDNLFNDGHDGSNRHGGGSQGGMSGTEGDEIIETTMNWYVDANTGMTRYDILA